jgi:hypothetical protein
MVQSLTTEKQIALLAARKQRRFLNQVSCDALLDRRPNQGNHLLPVTRRAVTEAHAHAAQPDGRDAT